MNYNWKSMSNPVLPIFFPPPLPPFPALPFCTRNQTRPGWTPRLRPACDDPAPLRRNGWKTQLPAIKRGTFGRLSDCSTGGVSLRENVETINRQLNRGLRKSTTPRDSRYLIRNGNRETRKMAGETRMEIRFAGREMEEKTGETRRRRERAKERRVLERIPFENVCSLET